MRMGNVCCISVTNELLILSTWHRHKSKDQCTWYQNVDRFNPGHMTDSVLDSAKYCFSILDRHMYCGDHHQLDHKLDVSTIRFKIKTKRCRYHHSPSCQTKCLAWDIVSTFRTWIAAAYDRHHSTHNYPSPSPTDVVDEWSCFKERTSVVSERLGMHRPTLLPQSADGESNEYHNPVYIFFVDLHKALYIVTYFGRYFNAATDFFRPG